MEALQRWADGLAGWAVPRHIVAAAPEPVYGFNVALFDQLADRARQHPTPSHARALEVLPAGGSVLDVGCGGGAASLALTPQLGHAIGVDDVEPMLAAFAERAEALDVAHTEVRGRWPDIAPKVPDADVVACHHVIYNAPDLAAFARALDRHARRRVVIETTEVHPLAWLTPYWQVLHGIDRPVGPSADDAVEALRQLGFEVGVARWEHDNPWSDHAENLVGFVRRRLGLRAERDDDIRRVLDEVGVPATRRLATLWWTPSSGERA